MIDQHCAEVKRMRQVLIHQHGEISKRCSKMQGSHRHTHLPSDTDILKMHLKRMKGSKTDC